MEQWRRFQVTAFDLTATLTSGQAFRWKPRGEGWEGIIGSRWVFLHPTPDGIEAQVTVPVADWTWLKDYLQLDEDLNEVLAHFPDDPTMRRTIEACYGLRLLRQDPWECLASFILSSTKQITQIQEVISGLSAHFGRPIQSPPGEPTAFSFPSAERLARTSESELRRLKLGFRAPYLLEAARRVAAGELPLDTLGTGSEETARSKLLAVPGIGPKIADCILLFGYGFRTAFPVDVWIFKVLNELYFPDQRVSPRSLNQFIAHYFGPQRGYAQQYLFHYRRTHRRADR